MSCPFTSFPAQVLVCTVVAAMMGILSDNSSLFVPSPEESIVRITGDDTETYLKKRHHTKKLFRDLFRYGYDDLIISSSGKSGFDWLLIASIVYQESGFNPPKDSTGREHHGLMQISRETAGIFSAQEHLADPGRNIETGSRYLRHLMDIFTKEGMDSVNAVKYALAAYNCGITKLQRIRDTATARGIVTDDWEDFEGLFEAEGPTRRYVSGITERYEAFKKLETNRY